MLTGFLGFAIGPLRDREVNLLASEGLGFVRFLETIPHQIRTDVRVRYVCHPRCSPKRHRCVWSHLLFSFFFLSCSLFVGLPSASERKRWWRWWRLKATNSNDLEEWRPRVSEENSPVDLYVGWAESYYTPIGLLRWPKLIVIISKELIYFLFLKLVQSIFIIFVIIHVTMWDCIQQPAHSSLVHFIFITINIRIQIDW